MPQKSFEFSFIEATLSAAAQPPTCCVTEFNITTVAAQQRSRSSAASRKQNDSAGPTEQQVRETTQKQNRKYTLWPRLPNMHTHTHTVSLIMHTRSESLPPSGGENENSM